MKIDNHTRYQHTLMLGSGADGLPSFSIIIKATFDIPKKNALPVLSEKQLPIFMSDENYDDDPQRAIRLEEDIVLFKPKSDIVLVGTAYAPIGKAVNYCDTALRVGDKVKKVRVYGDRQWKYASRLSMIPAKTRPKPFTKMELTYERAFGGIDESQGIWCESNLLGKGFAGKKRPKSLHNKPLPNMEDPDNLIKSWDSKPFPAGYGFWPRGCAPRSKFAGTFDEKWMKENAPTLPLDFSFSFYNAAHPDLQVEGYLNGDETVEMMNLTPEGYQRFQLPGICPAVKVYKSSREIVQKEVGSCIDEREININLDTVCFLPDEEIFYQVWRGISQVSSLECDEIQKIYIFMR